MLPIHLCLRRACLSPPARSSTSCAMRSPRGCAPTPRGRRRTSVRWPPSLAACQCSDARRSQRYVRRLGCTFGGIFVPRTDMATFLVSNAPHSLIHILLFCACSFLHASPLPRHRPCSRTRPCRAAASLRRCAACSRCALVRVQMRVIVAISILSFLTSVCSLCRLPKNVDWPARASVIPDRGTWLAEHRVADADALAFRELYTLDNTVQVSCCVSERSYFSPDFFL